MSAPAAAGLSSPYRGLAAFDDSDVDALFFFGREREIEVVAANLVANRLTVLYGPSGAGKSSLLRAGVARRLRALDGAHVVVHDVWSGDPVETLLGAVARVVPGIEPPRPHLPLEEALAEWSGRVGGDLYLVLDQFEELFAYRARANGARDVVAELAAVVRHPALRVNVLLAVRDDMLATLDVFQGRLRNVFANQVRLDRLDRVAARAAIEGPLARWRDVRGEDVRIEPPLVDAVLDEVSAGRVDIGRPRPGGEADADDRVEAPFLQLVMQRIWDAERADGSEALRTETLTRLGGAEAIVRTQLEQALDGLAPPQQDVAARIFNQLVTPSGTKIAHGVGDLADYAAVAPAELAPVLERLGRERILRTVDAGSAGPRYEIFHDVLADPVLAWRGRHEAARELDRARADAARRHRRLAILAAGSLAALAVVVAVAVYALHQRGEARDQATSAQARELAASALAELPSDPELGVLLAQRATRLEPTPRNEEVLRTALVASHVRLTIPGRALGFDERGLVVERPGGEVVVVDPATGESGPLPGPPPSPDHLSAERGGLRAVARGGTVEVTGLGGGVVRLPHPGRVSTVDVSPDGLVLTTWGNEADIWDGRTGKRLAVLGEHDLAVVDARFDPAGDLVATASLDNSARLWEAPGGARLTTLFGHESFVRSVAFSPDGTQIVTASRDKTARLWDSTGDPDGVLAGHAGEVRWAEFSPDGRWVATSSDDGTVRVWDAHPDPLLQPLARFGDRVVRARYTRDGDVAAQVGATVHVVDPATGEEVRREPAGPEGPPTARDGTYALLGEPDVTLKRPGRPDRVLKGHTKAVSAAAFSSDDRLLATAGADNDVRIWDLASGRSSPPVTCHSGRVADVSFSPDDRWLVTAGPRASCLVEVASGRKVFFLRGHEGPLTSAAFDPSGRTIVTASEDGSVRTYRCEICGRLPELEALAERRLARTGRTLTAAERARFLPD